MVKYIQRDTRNSEKPSRHDFEQAAPITRFQRSALTTQAFAAHDTAHVTGQFHSSRPADEVRRSALTVFGGFPPNRMHIEKGIFMEQACCGCCQDTDEAALLEEIARIARENKAEGSLIQVLHMAQGLYGHLPLSVQETVAEAMDIPLSEVSGVVSFYSFFTPRPRGKHTIRVCLGTACYVRGGKKIIESLGRTLGVKVGETTGDGLFTLEVARCIGACGLAPAMAIDDVIYKQVVPDKLAQILERYGSEGVPSNV